ncbi:TIGR03087 family PEP-CTERM/XrtA system glycosyltransferase [Deferrisoma camini]|uniref:TIGR03087 family PEP-CTERM/XrtA system glycosyltransferase n=1 Tax=Deferrisoma camini TaxID=1035120 RepID=UPI00055A08A0|nr:TIGR03087 family PEP-CTERM/XrtA system glycosyltransferase [Deferrisoma camini]
MTKNLLFIAHRVPYPPDKGEKIRAFHQIRHLAGKGWKVHLVALADRPEDAESWGALKRWCASVFCEVVDARYQKFRCLAAPFLRRPLSVPYFHRRVLQRRVDQILEQRPIRAVFCYSGATAEYVFRSKILRLSERLGGPVAGRPQRRSTRVGPPGQPPSLPAFQPFSDEPRSPRLVMDLVDVDSDKWAQYARWNPWPWKVVYRLESILLSRYELAVARAFDVVTLVSPAEAELFRGRVGPEARVEALANGVDLEYFRPGAVAEGDAEAALGGSEIAFCGAMDYYPNVDAVVWFANRVLPLVRGEVSDARFVIVGSSPAPAVQELAKLPGVEVTGRVEDVRPFVAGAQVSVAPIRIARGVQNKVLEAMAMGKPVVASPQAHEGIDASPGVHLRVCELRPEGFANEVVALLRDPELRFELGRRARERVEEVYRWDRCLEPLEVLLTGNSPRETRA